MKKIAILKIEKMGNLGVKNALHLGNSSMIFAFSFLDAIFARIDFDPLNSVDCLTGCRLRALRSSKAARHPGQ